MKKIILAGLLGLLTITFCTSAIAADDDNHASDWEAGFAEAVEKVGLEQAIADVIASGVSSKECVTIVIKMGFNPYSVVKAAIVSGADLSGVVEAASELNVSTAVISKAAVDAGAEILGVAQVQSQSQSEEDGFAYTPPPEDVTAPADDSVTYMPLTAEDAEAASEEDAAPATDAGLFFAPPDAGTDSSPEEVAPTETPIGTDTFGPTDLLAGLPVGGGTDPVTSSPYIP